MKYDFIAIDFETANEKRMSVCCAALIFFKDGDIVEEKEWLIKPPTACDYFKELNIQIHGITPDQVANTPEFDTIWDEFYSYIDGEMLIAHNAPFDMGVLTSLINHYQLKCPSLQFICTCNVARKTWDKQVNYTLKNIANHLGYIFNHHDAHDDAKTCGKILLDAFQVHSVNSIESLAQKINMRIGTLDPTGYYSSCRISSGYKGLGGKNDDVRISDLVAATTEFDEDHPFYQKKVTFTGTLISMTRRMAMQKIVDCGGAVANSFTKTTNFLVMGLQDYSRFVDGKESSKTKAAKQYIQDGHAVEIIDEDTFLRML